MKVLIVEDERPIARAIAHLVEQHPSFTVAGTATNGEAALTFLRENTVDLVITDIQMPVMTGIQLLEAMQKEFPHILAVVLSGYSDFEYARSAIRFRAFDYLVKSVTRENLFRMLDRAEAEWKQREHARLRDVLEQALAGHVTDAAAPRFYVVLTQTDLIAPQSVFDNCYLFHHEHDHVILVKSGHWSQDQMDAYFQETTAQNPRARMISTTQAITVRNLAQTVRRLRQALEMNSRLFQGSLFKEDCSKPPVHLHRKPLQITKPERTVESILTQRKDDLTEQTSHMLDSVMAQGGLLADIHLWLEAIFNDSRIVSQFPPDVLQEARMAAEDALLAANEKQCAAQLTAALRAIQMPTAAKRDVSAVVDEIARQLELNYHQQCSMEALAKQYNFVPSYLNKVFKQYKGVRPTEYLFNIRMERARVMLETMPDVLVKDVATSVGYNDSHYFSNQFKKATGLWPTELQERNMK